MKLNSLRIALSPTKLASLSAALVVSFALAACGGSDQPSGDGSSKAPVAAHKDDAPATGSGTPSDSTAPQDPAPASQQDPGAGNSCGTPGGTFTCGAQSCRIDDQYCVGDSVCLDFDGCPSCSSSSIHCGIGKTPSCSGTPNTGINVTCN